MLSSIVGLHNFSTLHSTATNALHLAQICRCIFYAYTDVQYTTATLKPIIINLSHLFGSRADLIITTHLVILVVLLLAGATSSKSLKLCRLKSDRDDI